MISGNLYLRNNVPCRFVSGGFGGIGAEVVTEVSPTGVDWDKNLKAIAEKNKSGKRRGGVDTIYWGFGPNDVIRYGKLYFRDGGVVELWAEGEKPKDLEIWIRFVNIDSRADFKKAFDLILSKQPIQEEHREWPSEMRVVGTPIGLETSEQDGKKVETWVLRQDTGAAGSWGKVLSSTTGFPASLRFVDGALASIGQSTSPSKLNLEK